MERTEAAVQSALQSVAEPAAKVSGVQEGRTADFSGPLQTLALLGVVEPALSVAPPPSMLQEDIYILGPGDNLSVKFLSAPELFGGSPILNDGTATLPLIGSVGMTGLTIS